MDGQRFDDLVRSLTESPSRRSLLGGLTGSLMGGILGLLGLEEDAAARKKKKRGGKKRRPKKCPPGRKRCGKRCCRKGQVCKQGKCQNKAKSPACTPDCTGKVCGDNGCGGSCGDCEDGCCDGGTCRTGLEINSSRCGHSGGICRDCGPGVACVNGVCTCTGNSCDGCCRTDGAGRPFCDTTMRPCGDTCIPRGACCHGRDSSIYQSTTPGCWGPETCSGVNGQGYGTCNCGAFTCHPNNGCCALDENGQPFCDTTKRRCGDICIPKTQCCQVGGEPGCNESITCAPETCEEATGTGQNPPPGICVHGTVSGVCSGACAAGFGYGNYYPEKQREVVCGRASRPGGNLCYCWRTMDGTSEGANVCVEDGSGPPCRSNSDCGSNEVCIRSGLSGIEHTCAPICA